MRVPSPPAPSYADKLCAEIATIARAIRADYREAFEAAYSTGSGAQVKVLQGATDPTGNTVADKESRRVALAIGARKLEQALASLRSAQGLIDMDHKPQHLSWSERDLRETEQRVADSKRRNRLPARKAGFGAVKG